MATISVKELAQKALSMRPGTVIDSVRKFGDDYVFNMQDPNPTPETYIYDSFVILNANTGEEDAFNVWSDDYIKLSREVPKEEYA